MSLALASGLQIMRIDEAVDSNKKLVVSIMPVGDDVTAGINVVSTAGNDSECDNP